MAVCVDGNQRTIRISGNDLTCGFQYLLAARAHAATGDTDGALHHLHQAIDHGWSDADATRACPELETLSDSPKWLSALERMAAEG